MSDAPAPDLDLHFSQADWDALFQHLRLDPRVLLHDKSIRTAIAARRRDWFRIKKEYDGDRSKMIECTVPYNSHHQDNLLESHVVRLIRPLSVIDPVYERAADMKVLSVGCRTEGEIFNLVAHGFAASNIAAIDVVSNSPLIQVGDMHALPFEADRFDCVICGWTAPYSRQFSGAISEFVRVLKSGGLIAIGLTREPPGGEDHARLVAQGSTVYQTTAEIMADFPTSIVGQPQFVQEPLDKTRKGALLMIVRVIK